MESTSSRRINLFGNGSEKKTGKVILCPPTLEEMLQVASSKLGEAVVQLRSQAGAVIDDLTVLRDWDAVYAVTKDQMDCVQSYLGSPCQAPVDGEDGQSDAHSMNSVLSTSSSIGDLREKSLDHPSGGSSPQPVAPPVVTSAVGVAKTPEPGDFGLRVTASVSSPDATSRHDWVRLNIGGKTFATTRATLMSDPDSMLARMFETGWCSATDSTGAFLIDRSPEYFEPLLNFLRHNKLILNEGVNPQGVLEEAKFFGLSKAIEPLEALVQTEELAVNGRFTRKEFLRMLSVTSSSSSLRCQGMDLIEVDLSNLDLRNINFKCANLSGCNLSNCDLSYCVFERADLSKANLDGAVIECVRMPRANLEGASLKGCTMDSRMGTHTNLEGANLKGAILDNSQMNGINLRLASLKGASLRSCNLRYAIMAGTDLENCDLLGSDLQHANLRGANIAGTNLQENCNLTGCDLQHANLRGSNLAGAVLEDIRAPLHMSQTVNVTTTVGGQQGVGLPQNGLVPVDGAAAAGAPPIVILGNDNHSNPLRIPHQQASNGVPDNGAVEDGLVNGRGHRDYPHQDSSSPPLDQH